MNEPARNRTRVIIPVLLTLVLLNLVLMGRLVWPLLQPDRQPVSQNAPVASAAQPSTPEPVPSQPMPSGQVFTTLPASAAVSEGLRQQGIILLSMRDGGYYHLFAYHPQFLPFTRITNGNWDDFSPAVSPDGSKVAYSSHQNGFWDIYILDLKSGKTTQMTDTAEYDGAPTWSPDGSWLAFESYRDQNLDIYLLPLDNPGTPAVRLTDGPAVDYAPDWSPNGRQIVFVSARSGEDEIWLADLDNPDQRFTNLSHSSSTRETHPAWSPDGQQIAWESQARETVNLVVWQPANPAQPARAVAIGQHPVWSPAGNALLATLALPNQTGLAVYEVTTGLQALPFTPLPETVQGMSWEGAGFVQAAAILLANSAPGISPAQWQPTLTRFPIAPAGRFALVALKDVQAAYPMLHDGVDESFSGLRQAIAAQTGWDFLASLENAYIPLTQPSAPGMEENWLYTGRAIAVNPILVSAGWMAVTREEINGRTYWRVFLKARYQDGSQGLPLTTRIWDLDARYNGDPRVYEQGGQLNGVPSGYWIDFTALASSYGWERLPALVNWVTYYPAARFNLFAFTDGLDWNSAMNEMYPPEAMITATSAPTYTVSPSPNPAAGTPTPKKP